MSPILLSKWRLAGLGAEILTSYDHTFAQSSEEVEVAKGPACMTVAEFTVEGPPVSHQSKNKAALAAWKAQVRLEATKAWTHAPMKGFLKCTIMNFFEGPDAPLDDDNMVKPIRDAMNGIVYDDDGQIRRSEHTQTSIDDAFKIRGVSMVILNAFNTGKGFVYIRIEDAPAQTQLPK